MKTLEFLNTIGGMIDSGITSILSPLALLYIGIIWLCLIIWTIRDSFLRSKNFLFQLFAGFLITFLNIFGFFMYLIVRPPLLLNEKKLLEFDEEKDICSKCKTESDGDFLYCSQCRNRLKSDCSKCGKIFSLTCKYCPYCGNSVQGLKANRKKQRHTK